MTDNEKYLTASEKLDQATEIWKSKMTTHYRIAGRLYREAVELRDSMGCAHGIAGESKAHGGHPGAKAA